MYLNLLQKVEDEERLFIQETLFIFLISTLLIK
jgi:hypothetical protein